MRVTEVKRRFNGKAFFSYFGVITDGCKVCGKPTRKMYGVHTKLPIVLNFPACDDMHAQEYVHRNKRYFNSVGSRWRELIFKATKQKKWR